METDGQGFNWQKSSYSNPSGNCVEVGWRKSSKSGPYTDNCVEVNFTPGSEVLVRDSKDRTGPVLKFTGPEWDAFVAGTKDGEFDIA